MNRSGKSICTLLGAVALGTSLSVVAHHSVNAQFDVNNNLVVAGVLTKIELINPHTYMHFDIKDASGKVTNWSFETAAPAALKMRGIAVRDTFKNGETYKIVYSPPRAKGTPIGLLTAVQLPDGRLVAMGATNNIDASKKLLGK